MSRSEFPVGFTELAVSVSFFDRGLELATDDAERRTDLTRAEARQFAVLEHVSKYRDAGRAAEAALVWELVDDALRSAWRRSGRTCFVRVTPDGGAEGIFEDVMGQQAIHDPVLVDLVAQLVFRPAVAADGGILSAMVQLRAGAL